MYPHLLSHSFHYRRVGSTNTATQFHRCAAARLNDIIILMITDDEARDTHLTETVRCFVIKKTQCLQMSPV